MQFHVVYIAEAHALDGWSPLRRFLVEEPITLEERMALAGRCVSAMSIQQIPALVDHIDDRVNKAYDAWPDRLFLVGKDGRVAFRGDRGPSGFRPDLLEKAIRAELDLP